ncbi:MAG TPA: deoxyribodipyrimidine photo-lyase [Fimbriimonadaceae bacterium]|nr:deoxyribodipyrimidine photo-lyase [Fimbriimonadaceae bacterium]
MNALCWVRRDLRLEDHAAFSAATEAADRVVVGFVFDTRILDPLPRDDRRITFIHRSIEELDARLKERGSRLLVAVGDPIDILPRWVSALGIDAVYANHDDEPYAQQRDDEVARNLKVAGSRLETFKDHVIFERREVLNQAGEPFRVYTPYSRAWRARLQIDDVNPRVADEDRLWPSDQLPLGDALPPLEAIGFAERDLWLESGTSGAKSRLSDFTKSLDAYGKNRDFPGLEGTSGLSVHLRFGTLSIRECVRTALRHGSSGADTWLSELIWRDFYQMILANFPHVVDGAFKSEFDRIDWPGTEAHFKRWCEGTTGYPLVDAAMQCLNATGWMHNRLRMVAASFLVKDLLVDWRHGEAYFAEKLLDFDLASNNGGWQWCASTGVDAQPTYRIFNPILQSRKFDPDGTFIRRWIPELRHLSNDEVHWPHGCMVDYPHPVVEHGKQRELALALLRSAGQADQ